MKIIISLMFFALLSLFLVNGLDESTSPINNSYLNSTNESSIENITLENPPEEEIDLIDYDITNLLPNEFKIGDIQFNLQILNKGNVELKNLFAVVSGKGFSTYNVFPIDSLKPEEKSYILVMGHVKETGEINLTIRISDKTFYQVISVTDPNAAQLDNQEGLKKKEEEIKKELSDLSSQLEELNRKYKKLEQDIETKRANNSDVSNIKIDDLKGFLRNAQSSIIHKDLDQSKASIALAINEYDDLSERLENTRLIKRSFASILKDNAVLISTLAGSVIALFSLLELLKKKKDHLYEKIKEVKLNKDTRVVVEKKKKIRISEENLDNK